MKAPRYSAMLPPVRNVSDAQALPDASGGVTHIEGECARSIGDGLPLLLHVHAGKLLFRQLAPLLHRRGRTGGRSFLSGLQFPLGNVVRMEQRECNRRLHLFLGESDAALSRIALHGPSLRRHQPELLVRRDDQIAQVRIALLRIRVPDGLNLKRLSASQKWSG